MSLGNLLQSLTAHSHKVIPNLLLSFAFLLSSAHPIYHAPGELTISFLCIYFLST